MRLLVPRKQASAKLTVLVMLDGVIDTAESINTAAAVLLLQQSTCE